MTFRVLSMNIHKGVSAFPARLVLERLRDNLRHEKPQVVLLQEVIGSSHRLARRYRHHPSRAQFDYLADSVWSHMAYGRNAISDDGDHGNAVLAERPLSVWHNLDISVSGYERRGCLLCRSTSADGQTLWIASVHLGLRTTERHDQLRRLIPMLQRHTGEEPLVLGGDFNDWRGTQLRPFERELSLVDAFEFLNGRYCRSFPAYWPLLPLDRVYCRGLRPVAARATSRGWRTLSDHHALIAELAIVDH